ncbi:MAG: DUF504 domain-containing protein [Acidobacteriota bacterium]
MPEPTLREVLNRLRWSPAEDGAPVILEVRNREAGEELVEGVRFEHVTEILAAGVCVADGTFLPYHRFVSVRRGGAALWTARPREVGS